MRISRAIKRVDFNRRTFGRGRGAILNRRRAVFNSHGDFGCVKTAIVIGDRVGDRICAGKARVRRIG